ncbi:hypothetical protein ACPVTF_05335 [Geobacillus icigianus]|uniref:hypothetical protein n=1 Tax=Geobacillus TaxID=129337 RepID=UPI0015581276|nr:hypothetical protein [Geobacillus subterraneus]
MIVLQRKRQAAEHVEQLLQDGEDLLQGGGNLWKRHVDRIDHARQLLQYRFSFIEQKFILSIHHIRVEKKWYRQVLPKTEKRRMPSSRWIDSSTNCVYRTWPHSPGGGDVHEKNRAEHGPVFFHSEFW